MLQVLKQSSGLGIKSTDFEGKGKQSDWASEKPISVSEDVKIPGTLFRQYPVADGQ